MKEKMNKKLYTFLAFQSVPFHLWNSTVHMRVKIMVFETSHERDFLVFGVSYVKYLTFDTPVKNAILHPHKPKWCSI